MNINGENHMNPNYPNKRGCLIDKRDRKSITVVDYPTWANKNGRFVSGEMNVPIPDNEPFEKKVETLEEAFDFARAEGYVVCTDPWTKPQYDKQKPIQEDDEY